MKKSKGALVISQIIEKIEMIIGGSWATLFILVAIYCMLDEETDGISVIVVLWLLGLLGVWVTYKGIKRKRMRINFLTYVAQLSNSHIKTLDDLAATTGTSTEIVKKNIRFMIRKGFFKQAYIDETTNQLIFASQKTSDCVNICICPQCGGTNKIPVGKIVHCEFCDTPIQCK